jgi:uncharacterized membrane protein (UPF0182 family)
MTVSSRRDETRTAALPELKRVIAAFSNRLIMEENLDKALSRLLGGEVSSVRTVAPATPATKDRSNMGVLALEYYRKAKEYLRRGDWAGYGRELENLEKILEDMSGPKAEGK